MGSGLDRLLSHGHFQKVAWLSFDATVLRHCRLTVPGPGTLFFCFSFFGGGVLGRIWNLNMALF